MEKIEIRIKTQANDIHICKHILLNVKSANDYDKPYWICSEDDYILGCYKTFKRAKEIINEIYNCNGKYEMPQE